MVIRMNQNPVYVHNVYSTDISVGHFYFHWSYIDREVERPYHVVVLGIFKIDTSLIIIFT